MDYKNMLLLILILVLSFGCNKDPNSYPAKYKRYIKQANTGNPVYMDSLAMLLITEGKDYIEAKDLLTKAAEKGYYQAMYNLAVNHPENNLSAKDKYFWMNLATAYCPQELYNLYSQKREEYLKKLKEEEIAAAQAEALKFFERVDAYFASSGR